MILCHNLEIFFSFYKHETFLLGLIKNVSQQICTVKKKMLNMAVQRSNFDNVRKN